MNWKKFLPVLLRPLCCWEWNEVHAYWLMRLTPFGRVRATVHHDGFWQLLGYGRKSELRTGRADPQRRLSYQARCLLARRQAWQEIWR